MKLKAFLIILISLTSHYSLAITTCDIYIQVSAFEQSQRSFKNISNFFGFTNGKKDFDIRLESGTETRYWTKENGSIFENSFPVQNYQGQTARLELRINKKGEWVFKLTIRRSALFGDSNISEIVFESSPTIKLPVPDFALTENSELIMTRSMTRSNPNSPVSVVIKQTMVFSKSSDGTIKWQNFNSTDSIRGNLILVGNETDYKMILVER